MTVYENLRLVEEALEDFNVHDVEDFVGFYGVSSSLSTKQV